ncbi:unnamed protein product, partial [Rotaria socialis]
MYLISKYHLPL